MGTLQYISGFGVAIWVPRHHSLRISHREFLNFCLALSADSLKEEENDYY